MRAVCLFIAIQTLVNGVSSSTIYKKLLDAAEGSMDVRDIGNNRVVFDLDIACPKDDYERKVQAASGRFKRKSLNFTTYQSSKWVSGIVPYTIASGFTTAEQAAIDAGAAEMNNYTCLNIKRRDSEVDYVSIIQGSGCYSSIGKTGGSQDISLGSGCVFSEIIVHEFGHAVGLFHEQSRPDRDGFVTINSANIQSGLESNFDKETTDIINDYGVPYDYYSIMHYDRTAFTNNGLDTITTTDAAFQSVIGAGTRLSFADVKILNLAYDCAASCSPVTCPDPGYQAQDCNCYCPNSNQGNADPVILCSESSTTTVAPTSETTTQQITTSATVTTDQPTTTVVTTDQPTTTTVTTDQPTTTEAATTSTTQPSTTTRDPTTTQPTSTQTQPTTTTAQPTTTTTEPTTTTAQPTTTATQPTTTTTQPTTTTPEVTTTTTQQSTETTTPQSNSTVPDGGVTVGPCTNLVAQDRCDYWANLGYCTNSQYQEYMRVNCAQSCGLCGGTSGVRCYNLRQYCDYWASEGYCTTNAEYMRGYCPKACGFCQPDTTTTPATTTVACADLELSCDYWASQGFCVTYETYMTRNCEKSCGLCGGFSKPCVNANSNCDYWANIPSYCTIYKDYLTINCPLACNFCTGVCEDKETYCGYWQSVGYCTDSRYEEYMKQKCARSCGTC